mgnify:FL=1
MQLEALPEITDEELEAHLDALQAGEEVGAGGLAEIRNWLEYDQPMQADETDEAPAVGPQNINHPEAEKQKSKKLGKTHCIGCEKFLDGVSWSFNNQHTVSSAKLLTARDEEHGIKWLVQPRPPYGEAPELTDNPDTPWFMQRHRGPGTKVRGHDLQLTSNPVACCATSSPAARCQVLTCIPRLARSCDDCRDNTCPRPTVQAGSGKLLEDVPIIPIDEWAVWKAGAAVAVAAAAEAEAEAP